MAVSALITNLFRTFSARISEPNWILGRWPRLLHFAPSALEASDHFSEIPFLN